MSYLDNYKAQRPDVPEDLLTQLPVAISWVEKMGFKILLELDMKLMIWLLQLQKDAKEKALR